MYPWAVHHRAGDTLTCAQNAYACSPSQSARASPRAILPASRARGLRCVGLRGLPDLPKIGSRA